MTRANLSLALLTSMLITGCSSMRYSQYMGKESDWPTSAGSMADASYAIPVYRDWPERPYEVIGSVRYADPRVYWNDNIIRWAAKTGSKNAGDALIIRFGAATPGSWLDSWVSRPTGYGQETTALVIKWSPESVVRARQQQIEDFWARFRKDNPDLAVNGPLLEMATAHLRTEGVVPYSSAMASKLVELLRPVVNQPKKDLAGTWLFKGTVQNKKMTSTESETFCGVAKATVTGDRLIIISTGGSVELSFNGTVDSGQVVGSLGFGGQASSLSVKCDGVGLSDKISIAFRSLVENGSIQGNLSFQR